MKKIIIISLLLFSGWMSAGAVDLNKENRDPKYVESIINRSQKIVDKLGITDAKVAEDVRNIIANRYFELNDIYEVQRYIVLILRFPRIYLFFLTKSR